MDKRSFRVIGIFYLLRRKKELSLKDLVSFYREEYASEEEVAEERGQDLERSFRRCMDELVDRGYVNTVNKDKKAGNRGVRYEINWHEFIEKKDVDHLLTALLFCGEHQAYRNIRDYLSLEKIKVFDDGELEKYRASVKEDIMRVNIDPDIYGCINKALEKDEFVRITYKGHKYEIFPVGYIMSRDGLRTYLYYIRKKQLQQCDVSFITDVEILEKKESQRKEQKELKEKYRESMQKMWDVGYEEKETEVRLKVLKNRAESETVISVLDQMESFSDVPGDETDDYRIYKGKIIGLADFSIWLRTYIETCIVLEPSKLREEIRIALCDKIKRYEE